MATKHEVLKEHLKEWLATKGNRKRRGELTKELAKATKLHPKSIGRSMRTLQLRKKRPVKKKRGRPRYYDKAVDVAIYELWRWMEYPCAETMHPVLSVYIDSAVKHQRWNHSDEVTGKVHSISLGTLKNRVSTLRSKENMTRGYSSTKPSTLQLLIPIRKSHTWFGLPPGYGQTDTVVHCGDLLSGDVVYSLGIVDFSTYWTEYTAQWNKGEVATRESLETLIDRFPFKLCEIHPDTGNEFINYHVYRWATEEKLALTRSEPYKKNDNMCIEERNNSVPRRHLGYVRMDSQSLVPLVSEILETACLIHNHFRPVRRMTKKERAGAKWHRTYEKVAKTSYLRTLEHPKVSDKFKVKLKDKHHQLDPLSLQDKLAKLKEELRKKLSKLSKK